ncbi:PDR/VanB family oxidoreductase [Bradyrhizobium sp. LHD-71]|uniref:PDR/VanB family oxidoreductase n=1 Tax=Bradyrhizobium sp. LHD-71 TaxID=3072141 RepID=UPI00280E3FD5|nr:PDR/VanB family oxidoreductase [Bradyrhizobium sp. LHD-71]MDQ8729947.1 PDR/VanB family oxidoreductase [Bradyrhizobium sp. LHD-71]
MLNRIPSRIPAEMQAPVDANGAIHMRLTAILYGGEGTNLFEFRTLDGRSVPKFTAGAHVDVNLPNGTIRQYSIASSQADRSRYLLGIKLEEQGRGGSRFLYEQVRVGSVLKIGLPRNNFALNENASSSVLIAGGIGITPILCMIDRLQALGRDFRLHYAVRMRTEALLAEIDEGDRRIHLHVDAEQDGRLLDIAAIIAGAPPDAELYCCGPAPMLVAFEAACAGRPSARVHLERFSAPDNVAASDGAYTVELAKSKRTLTVRPGQTLLQALQAAGLNVKVSCEQGICGTCETRVLAGIPDHRDMILSEEEKASNETMMVCCGASLTPTLVLDL